MITEKINENEFEVWIYDWTEKHDDYLCGHIKRQPDEDEESDLRYWMFYPIGGTVPMSVGDLNKIYTFTSELNIGTRTCKEVGI